MRYLFKRAAAYVVALVAVLLLSATSAAAATGAAVGVTFSLDPVTVAQVVLVAVLPLLVGLVTTRVTSSAVKAWLLAALSLLSSMVAELVRAWEAGAVYDVGAGLLLALPTFVGAVAVHYGLWKATGVTGKVLDAGRKPGEHAAL